MLFKLSGSGTTLGSGVDHDVDSTITPQARAQMQVVNEPHIEQIIERVASEDFGVAVKAALLVRQRESARIRMIMMKPVGDLPRKFDEEIFARMILDRWNTFAHRMGGGSLRSALWVEPPQSHRSDAKLYHAKL